MTWTFLWLILLMKIPIGGMFWLIWWTIKKADQEPAGDGGDDDGGSKLRAQPHRHPRTPRPYAPRGPRRGPHAGSPPASPRRVRGVSARARKVEH
jgi:hypothetical protein